MTLHLLLLTRIIGALMSHKIYSTYLNNLLVSFKSSDMMRLLFRSDIYHLDDRKYT